MKQVLAIVLIGFVWCTTAQKTESESISEEIKDQIQTSVRTWIFNKVLDNPSSYVSDEFYDFERVIDLSPAADSAHKAWINSEYTALKALFSDTSMARIEFADSTQMRAKSLETKYDSFQKEHIGYRVKHKFRAKDLKDEKLFYITEFVLNLKLEVIETTVRERKSSNDKTG